MPFKDKEVDGSNCSVTEGWAAIYPDPIQVVAGELIELGDRADIWDGYTWLWAKNAMGKEGWVPDCIISDSNPISVTEDYSAIELTCDKGQTLKAERVLHGWVFCSNDEGQTGWVPQRNLSKINWT